ncbi:MAG: serine protease [Pseudomonadota bacterium]
MILRTLLSLTIALQAQPTTRAQAQPLDEARPAIGRLNYAGFRNRQHCTAALIGPSEVLTAKHCVDGLAPGNLHVVLGYDGGAYSEHMRVRAVQSAQTADIARLCLERSSVAEPLPSVAADAEPQGRLVGLVDLIGYPRSRAHRQQRQRCAVTAEDGTAARLDCPAEPGMSGAPVLSDGRLVGVMSATAAETSVMMLLAALPPGGCDAEVTGADGRRVGDRP